MRYVELFAGAGGLSMGLEAAGMHPVAHAEIEPHARAVLRHHWPDTPLHGDVTQVDWTQYAGQVDLVAGGSPCQDLSVAGKRAGLAGVRSGLFYELIRAWDKTGATYCLWENVDGARSSNNGEDFAAVLSAFVGATVAVPSDGWRSSGVAAGRTGVAAWRVLDLQHFGPPQRRRRIFVVAAQTGGADPAEILALSQGVCGHPSPREQSRQGTAQGAAGGAGGSIDWDNELNARVKAHGLLMARGKSSGDRNEVLAFHHTQTPITGDVSPSVGRTTNGMAVLALDGTDIVGSLLARADSSPCVDRGQPAVLTFTPGFVARGEGPRPQQDLVQTLGANTQGDQAPHIVFLASGQANAEVVRDGVPTLNTIHEQPIVTGAASAGRPRRLTPLECERLMGWPDRHTAQGIREDGTAYALADTARYRLCGNGVGTPVAAWIGRQIMAAAGA